MTATAYPFRSVRASNLTGVSALPACPVPTTTKPSGAGIIDLFDGDYGLATNTYMPKFVQLQPYGTDANDEQFEMRVLGWSKTAGDIGNITAESWVPQLLVKVTVTMGNIAAAIYGTNHFLADTIVVDKGDGDASVISPADDTPASILLHTRGCELLQFDFSLTTALTEGVAANCLWRAFDQN